MDAWELCRSTKPALTLARASSTGTLLLGFRPPTLAPEFALVFILLCSGRVRFLLSISLPVAHQKLLLTISQNFDSHDQGHRTRP